MPLRSYKLVSGEGDQDRGEGCWMSIGRWMVGELGWTDKADCVSPIINSICIKVNDLLNDADRLEIVGPRLLDPFGSAGSDELEYKRACWLVDQMSLSRVSSCLRPLATGNYFREAHLTLSMEQNPLISTTYVIAYEFSCRGYIIDVDFNSQIVSGLFRSFVEDYLLPTMYHLIDMGKKAPVEQVNACKLECAT